MSNFMPHNQEKAQKLEEKLSESIFRSVKDFVQFYNSGLINKSFGEVKDTAREITETFKNVKEKSGKLVLISQEEVFIDEIIEKLKPWEGIVKAKRETIGAIQEKRINEETLLVLNEKYSLDFITNDEEGNTVKESISGEKLFNKTDDISQFLAKSSYGDEYSEDYQGYVFSARDLATIDTSFVQTIKENIPED